MAKRAKANNASKELPLFIQGRHLFHRRRSAKVTQAALAKALGINPQTMNDIENGRAAIERGRWFHGLRQTGLEVAGSFPYVLSDYEEGFVEAANEFEKGRANE